MLKRQWYESRKNVEMNIWLNPKYSQTVLVHAEKIRIESLSTTIPEMGVHSSEWKRIALNVIILRMVKN